MLPLLFLILTSRKRHQLKACLISGESVVFNSVENFRTYLTKLKYRKGKICFPTDSEQRKMALMYM